MEFFPKTFPHFIWLLRDVTKDIPPDCKDIKDFFLKKVISKAHPFEILLPIQAKTRISLVKLDRENPNMQWHLDEKNTKIAFCSKRSVVSFF